MKKSKNYLRHLLLIVTLIALSFYQGQTADEAFCFVQNQFEGTKLFTTVGETQFYNLNQYFQGTNLTFSVTSDQKLEENKNNQYKIIDGVQIELTQLESSIYKRIIGIDVLNNESEKAESQIAILSENASGNYKVSFGTTNSLSPSLINDEVELKFENEEITCFDVVIVTEKVAVVDCTKRLGSTQQEYYNVFFIVTTDPDEDEEIVEQILNSDYTNDEPYGRKTIRYHSTSANFDQTFIISATPFDYFRQDDDIIEDYLNIYRYVENTSQDSKSNLGHLIFGAPITNRDLGFPKDLKIADFSILGDWIYVLDHFQGVALFQYTSNKVVNCKVHSLSINPVKRWGMDIHLVGSVYKMYLAETTAIKEYSLLTYSSEPKLVNTYKLLHQNSGTVQMQSNPHYITIAQGMFVTIYDQGVTAASKIKAQLENVQAYFLWYTSNIDIYHSDKFENYILQDPQLKVQTKFDKPESSVTIVAVSTNFQAKAVCSIKLRSYIISDPNSKAPHYTDMEQSIYWNYQDTYLTSIPLSNYWIGPNIVYNYKSLEQDGKDDEKNYVVIDQPQVIDIVYDMQKDQSDDWVFSAIIPVDGDSEGLYYSIHQNKKNQLYIFACQQTQLDISLVECGRAQKVVELNSRIITYSYGLWGNQEDIMAFVLDDLPGYVQFYYLYGGNGHYMGDLWFELQIGNNKVGVSNKIIDIELLDNALYTTVEGKTQKFISIITFDEVIDYDAYITPADAAKWTTAVWDPEYVTSNTAHPNTIFIKNQKKVFALDISGQVPKFLSSITLESSIGNQVFVTPKSLVLAQAADKIVDYALFDLNDLSEKEFEYPTYEFEFIYPFTVAHGKQSGQLFILASDKTSDDLYLLIYRTGVEKIRTLVKAVFIEADVKIDSSKTLNIIAGGDSIDYVYLQYNDKKVYFRAPVVETVNLIALSITSQNVYVDNFKILFEMQGWNGYKIDIEDEVTLVNSQTYIKLYHDNFQKQVPAKLYANNTDNASFTFDVTDWYNGSVVSMSCTCSPNPELCGDQIKFTGVVEEQKESPVNNILYTIDMFSIDDTAYVLKIDEVSQASYDVFKINGDLSHSKFSTIYTENQSIFCENMIPSINYNGYLEEIIVICYDYEFQLYVAYTLVEDGEARTKRFLPDIEEGTIHNGQVQYFHNALFVNSISEQTAIIIFDLNDFFVYEVKGKEIELATPLQQINKYTFQNKAPNLYITSFFATYDRMDIKEDKQKFIKLFITDSLEEDENVNAKIWFATLNVEKKFQFDINQLQTLNYDIFVQNHKLFVNELTQLHKLVVADINFKVIGEDDFIIYQTIIVTSNTASYEMDLYFQIPNDVDKSLVFKEGRSSIINVYNNYGSAMPFNKVQIYGDTVAMAYFNRDDKIITVALYELREKKPFQKLNSDSNLRHEFTYNIGSDDSHVPLHAMEGGAKFEDQFLAIGSSDMPIFPFILLQQPGKSRPTLISADFSEVPKLRSYNFNPHTIKIETSGKFEEQTLKVQLESDYSLFFDTFTFKVNPGSVKAESGGMPWWGVFLIILGSLAVLAGVGFFVWKWKFQGGSDAGPVYKKIDVEGSDAGYSLQAPLKA